MHKLLNHKFPEKIVGCLLLFICMNTWCVAQQSDTIPAFSICINEIMADPEPLVGLPSVEYIELYNQSGHEIDISAWSIHIGNRSRTLNYCVLPAGDYLLLCKSDKVFLWPDSLSVLGVESMPALTNGGGQIILRDAFSRVISFVNYSDDWYSNEKKREGGWSLEQIDPENPCQWDNNWKASECPVGGTPAAKNSVYEKNPDYESPKAYYSGYFGDRSFGIRFSEPLLPEQNIEDILSMSEPEHSLKLLAWDPILPEWLRFELDSDIFACPGISKIIIESGVKDCAGNQSLSDQSFMLAEPEEPELFTMVFNEILFDAGDDNSEYFELFNNSQSVFDLHDFLLGYRTNPDEEFRNYYLCNSSCLIFPGQYIAISKSLGNLIRHYQPIDRSNILEAEEFPSFHNTRGSLSLLDRGFQVIDSFSYVSDMHFYYIGDSKDVSLEKINPSYISFNADSWHSASALSGYGTPGYINSQFQEENSPKQWIECSSTIVSPNNDGYQDKISISFSSDLKGYLGSLEIYDMDGRLIKILLDGCLLGSRDRVVWNGAKENAGICVPGMYVLFFRAIHPSGKKAVKKMLIAVQ